MSVLFISYNGLTEPLGRRQVIPYVVGLAARGWPYTVISFEKRETADEASRRQVRELLDSARVRWLPLAYHHRPSVPATGYDIACGVLKGLREAKDIGLIHARSTVPAVMAQALARLLGVPWIFDVRGLIAEEYADAGHWPRGGLLFRLTNAAEDRLIARAGGVVVLTEAIREILQGTGKLSPQKPTAVVPCSADETTFRPSAEARARVRAELRLGTRPILVYAGSLGSWYRMDAMMRFFSIARAEIPELKFLVLTPQIPEALREAECAGLSGEVVVVQARPDQVPDYLSASDAGICFLVASFSKKASSPTKYGEYLASGLPVVTDSWTGDSGRLRDQPGWIVVDRFDVDEYRRAARDLRALLLEPERARAAALALAAREFDLAMALNRYDELYRKVTPIMRRAARRG